MFLCTQYVETRAGVETDSEDLFSWRHPRDQDHHPGEPQQERQHQSVPQAEDHAHRLRDILPTLLWRINQPDISDRKPSSMSQSDGCKCD